jgi:cell fate (sporulation/competence/biofilm development) regulator YlbF (YheA/YmcA/DUF963 family)
MSLAKLVYNQVMQDIYSLSYELKELLSQDERVVLLNKLEKEMNDNEEVMALAYQKDLAISNLSDAINHFGENSEEAKKAQHELFLKKEALDNHPLVRDYLKAYQEVRELYFNLNDILFSNLRLKMQEHK